ncbi:MAG: peroxidase [Myxococcaceae bacterium]|nr:peroxidase [Myxococcaceae bacterium]
MTREQLWQRGAGESRDDSARGEPFAARAQGATEAGEPPLPEAAARCDDEPPDEAREPWRETFLGGTADSEQALFRSYAHAIRKVQQQARGKSSASLRGLHARMIAGTHAATLRVDHAELSGGYLRPGREYGVTLRFSSASSRPQPDPKRDARGIALRIHRAAGDGGACDLLLTNAEVSHVRDADEFMAFTSALARGPVRGVPELLLRRGKRGAQMLGQALLQVLHGPRSLAEESFWSRAPFLLGGRPVRYQLRPARPAVLEVDGNDPNYLYLDLRAKLMRGPLSYELWAQPFVDQVQTPMEDATARWQSPPRRIATLTLAPQQLPEPGSDTFRGIDALCFSPWNTLPSMRPLGSLNRARKYVYSASQQERTRAEPSAGALLGQLALRGLELSFAKLNQRWSWDQLPPWVGVANLIALRETFRRDSLTTLDDPSAACPHVPAPREGLLGRTSDGRFNNLINPSVGAVGARFGRNGPLARVELEIDARLRTPDPRAVSERLLKRAHFQPATTLNLLAVAWIQFQAHDWFKHREAPPRAEAPSAREQLATELGVYPTLQAQKGPGLDRSTPAAHENEVTHWWDCSQLYGSSREVTERLRGPGGTLELDRGGLLRLGPDALPRTGNNSNWWIGLELLHTLFVREHNAICGALARDNPSWTSDRLFEVARLINVAVMDKIHTVEWTPAVLANETLRKAMRAHWFGLLPGLHPENKRPKSELLSGIPGSPSDDFEVPYALTEEFVSVYRLHPMLPDQIALRSALAQGSPRERQVPFRDVAFERAPLLARSVGVGDLAYSLGLACAGKMCLHNYPEFLRQLPPQETRTREIDLAAVDIFRDRERGVARYNEFRAQFGLPRKRELSELSSDPKTLSALRDLYSHIDDVDLLVGLLSETPPVGFGISDTAFRVFIGMASRRLKADRFITEGYREELYSQTGLRWIRDGSFKSVLMRHLPELHHVLGTVNDPFAPWSPREGLPI